MFSCHVVLMYEEQKVKFETKHTQSAMKHVSSSIQDPSHLCQWLETSHLPLYLLFFPIPTPNVTNGDSH